MPRYQLPPEVKERVLLRYNYTCAICGENGRERVDVAHLYQDANKRQASFEEVIVLCSNHNQAQARANKSTGRGERLLFNPRVLHAQAADLYENNAYARSYALNRLAAYYFEKQHDFTDAVGALSDAISGARPFRWSGALKASIREAARLCLSQKVGIIARWQLLSRIAIALYDYGMWEVGSDIWFACERLSKKIKEDHRAPERLEFERDLAFRHGALVRGSANKLKHGESTKDLVKRLLDDAAAFKKRGDFKGFVVNLDSASRLTSEILGDHRKAHDYSEEALNLNRKCTNTWVIQELDWREAEYFSLRNDRKRTLECVQRALTESNACPVILEPTANSNKPIIKSVRDRVKTFGFSWEEVLDGASIPKQPTPEKLAWSKREIQTTVRAICGN